MRRRGSPKLLSAAVVTLWLTAGGSAGAIAGDVDVVGVKVTKSAPGVYRFDVTLRHEDTGWDHYADKWEVLGPDGTVLGERVLLHPHVDEQPFTRSASVRIPDGVTSVTVRGHDKVHGFSGKTVIVDLPE